MAQSEFSEEEWRKGPWTPQEDQLLLEHVKLHGEGKWNNVSRLAGLKRNGKSCRLRWVNYLRPDLKRGQITPREETLILELHARWGNRWSTIARSLPGRTDNEIKNYWRTHFKKKETIPSHNPQKSNIHLLKRQQFQLQQQQKDQIETKRVMSIFDEKYQKLPTLAQHRQETADPTIADEQGYLYSVINGYESMSRVSTNVGWDELWKVENDIYGNMANRGYYPHDFALSFY